MTKKNTTVWIFTGIVLITASCKKNDAKQSTVAELITVEVTNISSTTATSGGTISGNGGSEIIVSGLCWSKTSQVPTISDDTTITTIKSESYTSTLTNLDASTTYYVRAYAINAVGTGYGNVINFTTSSGAPEARGIIITGEQIVSKDLTVNYTYFDEQGDPENGTAIQWYVVDDTISAAVNAIPGANVNSYTLAEGDKYKYIKVGVTPNASSGVSPGVETFSQWLGPITELITFTYNGQEVTYGTIVSPVTHRVWMDRNLGANGVATSHDEANAYGDQFQWGRPDDGHQLGTANKTSIQATSDTPGHSDFITVAFGESSPNDWRSDNNNNRWNTNPRGPCPTGWHVPTQGEWAAETGITDITTAYSQLKLTAAGFRYIDGYPNIFAGQLCNYWSSTVSGTGAYGTYIGTGGAGMDYIYFRAGGFSIRCIKD